jgi:hypothetical protein
MLLNLYVGVRCYKPYSFCRLCRNVVENVSRFLLLIPSSAICCVLVLSTSVAV